MQNIIVHVKQSLLSRPLDFRSRDQDRDLDKMNSSALESRDHGLEITTLPNIHTVDGYSLALTYKRSYHNTTTLTIT